MSSGKIRCDECVYWGNHLPDSRRTSCVCGGVGCNSCEPGGRG